MDYILNSKNLDPVSCLCFFHHQLKIMSAAAAKSLQLCLTLCNPIDGWQPTRLRCPWDSPGKNTGVGCHFLLQRMKVKVKVKSLSHVQPTATPWTAAFQAPPSMGFSSKSTGVGCHCLLWEDPWNPSNSEILWMTFLSCDFRALLWALNPFRKNSRILPLHR